MWDVVATVKEPLPLVAAFVAHHLKVGASWIHLYFDDPADPAYDFIRGTPGVRAVRCDGAHWAAHGGRPTMHTQRQIANAAAANAICQSRWLLHCDADEFLIRPRVLREKLAAMPDDVCVVRLRTWERCFVGAPSAQDNIFAGWARGPTKDCRALERVYGDIAGSLRRGMAGYAGFKALSRPRCGLLVGIHSCYFADADGGEDRTRIPPRETLFAPHILHFDGMTPAHLQRKFENKRIGPNVAQLTANLSGHRVTQVLDMTERRVDQVQFFHLLRTVPAATSAILQEIDRLTPIKMDPGTDAAKRWPAAALSFTSAAFDAHL